MPQAARSGVRFRDAATAVAASSAVRCAPFPDCGRDGCLRRRPAQLLPRNRRGARRVPRVTACECYADSLEVLLVLTGAGPVLNLRKCRCHRGHKQQQDSQDDQQFHPAESRPRRPLAVCPSIAWSPQHITVPACDIGTELPRHTTVREKMSIFSFAGGESRCCRVRGGRCKFCPVFLSGLFVENGSGKMDGRDLVVC